MHEVNDVTIDMEPTLIAFIPLNLTMKDIMVIQFMMNMMTMVHFHPEDHHKY